MDESTREENTQRTHIKDLIYIYIRQREKYLRLPVSSSRTIINITG